jgi:hypothetical protein
MDEIYLIEDIRFNGGHSKTGHGSVKDLYLLSENSTIRYKVKFVAFGWKFL